MDTEATRVLSGRFAEWATDDLAAQCRTQAREQLDPEFTEFMFAVADRLASGPCRNCLNTGWVCENHRDRPWDGHTLAPEACGCGAGAPCEVCCDTDGSPEEQDAQRLDGEAATAGAEGIARSSGASWQRSEG